MIHSDSYRSRPWLGACATAALLAAATQSTGAQIQLGVQQQWDLGSLYGHSGHVGVRSFVNLDADPELEVIFNLNRSADFVALDMDGTELWRSTQQTTNEKIAYYPVISEDQGLLFFGVRTNNTVYAVNLVDNGPGDAAGSLAWSRQLAGASSTANMSLELADIGVVAGYYVGGGATLFDWNGNVQPGWPTTFWQMEQLLGAGDLDGDGQDEIFSNSNGGDFRVYNRDGSELFRHSSQMTHNDYAVIADINQDGANPNNLGNELLVALDDDNSHPGEGDEIVLFNQLGNEVARYETGAEGLNYAVGDIRPDLPGLEIFFGNEGTNTIGLLDHKLNPIFTSDLNQVASELGISLSNAAGQTALADLDGDGTLELLINSGENASAGILVFASTEINGTDFDDPGFDASDVLIDSILGKGWDFDPQSVFSHADPASKRFVDVNGDGLDDIITSSVGANSATGDQIMYLIGNTAPPAQQLVYDTSTGELSIDTLSQTLLGYLLTGSGFVEENHSAVLSGTLASLDGELSEADPLGGASGVLNLGAVLPAGLSEPDFLAWFAEVVYLAELGQSLRSFDLVFMGLPADLDGDGDVDGVDLSQFFSAFTGPDNGPAVPIGADLDGDGDVDGVDLSQAFTRFTGPAAPANVPEPSSLALLGLVGLLASRRRRCMNAIANRKAQPMQFKNQAALASTTLACLVAVGPAAAQVSVITDFSNFAQSDNMLNGTSHNREQGHATAGSQISIANQTAPTNGSASQELFGTTEFVSFTTDGYRLEVDLLSVARNQSNERVGIMTASTIPAGGPGSGDVRAAGDYFYWAMQGESVRAGMFSAIHGEEEGGLVDPAGSFGVDWTGLYMQRNGGAWDLGVIDINGNDVYVQSRSTINGKAITADGSAIGLYSDMRDNNSAYTLDNLSYGPLRIPGDTDDDGDIDNRDLLLAMSNYTGSGGGGQTPDDGDTDGDGDIDELDLSNSVNAYTGPGFRPLAVTVPEPGSACALTVLTAALARRRRSNPTTRDEAYDGVLG